MYHKNVCDAFVDEILSHPHTVNDGLSLHYHRVDKCEERDFVIWIFSVCQLFHKFLEIFRVGLLVMMDRLGYQAWGNSQSVFELKLKDFVVGYLQESSEMRSTAAINSNTKDFLSLATKDNDRMITRKESGIARSSFNPDCNRVLVLEHEMHSKLYPSIVYHFNHARNVQLQSLYILLIFSERS